CPHSQNAWRAMPCSPQSVETAPRGAPSGHCEIARRTEGSMGSLTATTRTLGQKCHHQDRPNCHQCPDAELSPVSWEMTGDQVAGADDGALIDAITGWERAEATVTAHRLAAIGGLAGRRWGADPP